MDELARELFGLAEQAYLHSEAVELLDQCLTEGDDHEIRRFLEQQIAHRPPRLDLLRALLSDLRTRLTSLFEYRSDVRESIVKALMDGFGVDVSPYMPEAPQEYVYVEADGVLEYMRRHGAELSDAEEIILRKTISASTELMAQLNNDIRLVQALRQYIQDWLMALSVEEARSIWSDHPKPTDILH